MTWPQELQFTMFSNSKQKEVNLLTIEMNDIL